MPRRGNAAFSPPARTSSWCPTSPRARLDGRLEELGDKARDNAWQQDRIEELAQRTTVVLILLAQGIDLRRKKASAAQLLDLAHQGKKEMDAVRDLVVDMQREEQRLLQERERASHRAYRVAVTTGLLTAALGVVLVGAFGWLLNRALAARQRAAMALHEQREWFRTTLASIGDAAIATTPSGGATFLNPVARALTGWGEEALGQPLETVFQIVNERTRQTVASPAARALAEDTIVGLANRTLLISNVGKECPIDDSAAPIRDKEGRVAGVVLVFRDVTERQQAREALEKQARLALMRADTSMTLARSEDLQTVLQQCAEVLVERLGVAFLELLQMPEGSHISASASDDDLARRTYREYRNGVPVPARQLPMQVAVAEGVEVRGAELTLVFGDSTERQIYGNAVPLRNADGSVRGAIAAFMDVTALKQAEKALQQAGAGRRKDEFLATLAHELRNPLAPIRNALQLIRLARNAPETMEQARTMMERQLQQMVRLIDDLMDVSRNKLVPRKERVDLAAAHSAVESSRPLIASSGHELTVTLPLPPVYLGADLARLSQVFANLLNNAAKYTERGGRISRTAEREGAGKFVAVTVRDNGVGIPTDMLLRVFEMFTQVDQSLERSQGGLGIGLSLVRALVEMHGGTVEAHSDGPGQGSAFVVRLPVLAGGSASGPAASRRRESPDFPVPHPGGGRQPRLGHEPGPDAGDAGQRGAHRVRRARGGERGGGVQARRGAAGHRPVEAQRV